MTVDNQIICLLNNSTMSVREISKHVTDVNRSTVTVHIRNLRRWGEVIPLQCRERRVGFKGVVYTRNNNRRLLG